MAQQIAVALYHREHFSRGSSRKVFGYEAYHWAILIMPETSQGRDCHAFEATDAAGIDPVTFRMTNPTMDWWFRVKENFDPMLSARLLGRIVIGQVPDEMSTVEVRDFFEGVPLPVKNTHPQQSCVTWAVDAVGRMQQRGWVPGFDLDQFKDSALSYADERLRGSESREPGVKQYNA